MAIEDEELLGEFIVESNEHLADIENELLAMNRNAVEHEYLTELISGNLKQLRLAITGRPVA